MNVLEVNGLTKKYPAFTLSNVSFTLSSGKITGFIGRNGAGKTTTLKSIMGFVHPDAGEVRFFDMQSEGNELLIKQDIGYVEGGIDYYPHKKIRSITRVTRSFYKNWDDEAYARYLKLFALDENKTPSELSAGMKVKYSLALALSHNAKLLILDEPTSGLDPVSRDDLLEVFMSLCDEGKTIFFSTHITSDLDKCADDIVYIKDGEILAESGLAEFVKSYRLMTFEKGSLTKAQEEKAIGARRSKAGMSAIIKAEDAALFAESENADLDSIMVHLEKEE